MGSTCAKFYNTTSSPGNVQRKTWLSSFDDTALILSLTIPGSHNSCALHGGDMHQCQSWSLSDQFRAGIRFVDIKCKYRDPDQGLQVYHGRRHQKVGFLEVIKEVSTFLTENPSEFIIMKISEEDEYNTSMYKQKLEEWLKDSGEKIIFPDPRLTLGEARGKIILIQCNEDRPETPNVIIHDDPWKYSYAKRWEVQLMNMKEANKRNQTNLHTTMFSGFTYFAYPYSIAWRMNEMVYIYASDRKGTFGVVAVDFPGVELIESLIDTNRLTE